MAHAPVRVITVEREYGSHGGELAQDLAARLGWRLLDSELAAGAARMAGVDPKAAAKYDERLDPWYRRYGKIFWLDPVYVQAPNGEEVQFDCDRMMKLIKQEILDAAKQGNCVLVGRGSACALAGVPGCFHIFVYATAKAKREWFARTFPQQAQHAEQHLASVDKRRSMVIREFYQQEWCSRGHYHMLLNSCIGVEAMTAAVMCAAKLCPAESAESAAS